MRKTYETMTSPFESNDGDLTLTYATGPDSTFDDMTLDTYLDGVKSDLPVHGVKAIMEYLNTIAWAAPSARNMRDSMVSRWPGLRTYLPKKEA